MTRYDGKGFHPTVRPWFPHRKRKRTKLQVSISILPKTWQLAMMKLGIRFVALRHEHLESVDSSFCGGTLLEPIYIEAGCSNPGTWYVDTNGCSMVQANSANPPPDDGFVSTALNKAKGFIINLGKALTLAGLMALAHACNKDPLPEPTPTPEPEPFVPTKEIVVPWVWGAYGGFAPPVDTIENYTKDPYVKYVFIYILTIQNIGSTWEPEDFHRARDTLQNRINIDSTKVRGRGIIQVGRDGAHIHPDTLTQKYGMWEPDSLWFTKHGWRIQRFEKHK